MAIIDLSTPEGRAAANQRDREYQSQFTPVPAPPSTPSYSIPSSNVPPPPSGGSSMSGNGPTGYFDPLYNYMNTGSIIGNRNNVPAPPKMGGGVSAPGQQMPQGMMPPGMFMPPRPTIPAPPVRDMNAITGYVDGQIGSRLNQAASTRDVTTGNLNTQAGQLRTRLTTQAEQQRQRLAATREQSLKGLKTGYDQTQQSITDQRNLQDVSMQRQGLNPAYSGADAYKQGMMQREREITDRNNNQIYTNQVGGLEQDYQNNITGIEQDIANRTSEIESNLQMKQAEVQLSYQNVANAAPAERERLMKEAMDQERSYQLALRNADRDDVLLELNKQKTAMEQTRLNEDIANTDWEQRFKLKDQAAREQYQKDTFDETKKQNNIKNWQDAQARFPMATGAVPKDSFEVLLKQYEGQISATELEYLGKQAEVTGVLPDKLADLMGVPKGTQTQKAKEFAADQGYKDRMASISERNARTSEANAGRSARSEQQDTLYKQWQYTGKAPAGIPGVSEGTPYRTEANNQNKPVSYKENPEFAQDYQYLTQNKERAASMLQQNAQQFITKYGYDGYQALIKAAQE